jgi:transcriptional regulator with XRE-family HTH domain
LRLAACQYSDQNVSDRTRRLYDFGLEPEVRDWLDSLSGSDQRCALGLSVADLAGRADMTIDDIECIEEGGAEPAITPLWRLAAALDADVRLTPGHDLGSVWRAGTGSHGAASGPGAARSRLQPGRGGHHRSTRPAGQVQQLPRVSTYANLRPDRLDSISDLMIFG